MGMKKAEITSSNIIQTVNALSQCARSQSNAFIQSWNGDSYENACIGLTINSLGTTGSVNVVQNGVNLPVLCQAL
jgi:hypothetical protein